MILLLWFVNGSLGDHYRNQVPKSKITTQMHCWITTVKQLQNYPRNSVMLLKNSGQQGHNPAHFWDYVTDFLGHVSWWINRAHLHQLMLQWWYQTWPISLVNTLWSFINQQTYIFPRYFHKRWLNDCRLSFSRYNRLP